MISKVAIWMGLFEDKEKFQQYTEIEYTKDGDSIDSEFEKDFMLKYYDRDLVEKDFSNKTTDLDLLLEGFSYSDSFQKENLNIEKEYNSVILIYDLENITDIATLTQDKKMDFIGQITYEKIVEDKW